MICSQKKTGQNQDLYVLCGNQCQCSSRWSFSSFADFPLEILCLAVDVVLWASSDHDSWQQYSSKRVVSAVSAILFAYYCAIGVKKLSPYLIFNQMNIYGDELWIVIERIRCCLSSFHLIIKSNFREQSRLTGHTPLVGDHGLTWRMLSRAGPCPSPWVPQEKLENITRQQEKEKLENIIRQKENWNTFLKQQMLFKHVFKSQEKFWELVCKCK